MASVYRFIVENKGRGGSTGRKSATDGISKKGANKGKAITLLNSAKGGVEHNRYMRAVNPVLNKITGGWYEKSMRLGRAGLGLVKFNSATGAIAGISGVAITIIISFVLQMIMKIQARDRVNAERQNAQDFKALENGVGAIRGAYDINVNMWSGRRTFNQNK